MHSNKRFKVEEKSENLKRIFVTGANKGVGFGICRKLLFDDDECSVILGVRNEENGNKALEQLLSENELWRERISLIIIDVSDEESVQDAANQLAGIELTAIVNNAGIAMDLPWSDETVLAGIARKTLNTNFWGIIRVCRHFTPLLSCSGRIINISSGAGQSNMQKMSQERRREFLKEDLTIEELEEFAGNFIENFEEQAESGELPKQANGWWLQAYGFSKACVNMLTRIQARENPTIMVNCCTPGFVATDMVAGYSGDSKLKSIDEGADTPVWLCLGEVGGSGLLFGNERKQLEYGDEYGMPK